MRENDEKEIGKFTSIENFEVFFACKKINVIPQHVHIILHFKVSYNLIGLEEH